MDFVVLSRDLLDRLVGAISKRFPEKSFGYLVSDCDRSIPTDFLLFEGNVRNAPDRRPEFEAYGRYFLDHRDAGFAAEDEETWRIQKEIWTRGLFEVAVFHSHQRHPANFSKIDYDMHIQRFESLWHLIISLRNPILPQVRAYAISKENGVRELRMESADGHRA